MPSDTSEFSRPLGTGSLVFQHLDDTIFIPFLDAGSRQLVELIFPENEIAQEVCDYLSAQLHCNEPTAFDLKTEYNIRNLMAFLRRYIQSDDIAVVHWDTLVKLNNDGLQCRLPNGTWSAINFEDLVGREFMHVTKHAQRPGKRIRSVQYAYRRLGLPSTHAHQGWIRIAHPAADFFAE